MMNTLITNLNSTEDVRKGMRILQKRNVELREEGMRNVLNAMCADPGRMFTNAELTVASKVGLSAQTICRCLWRIVDQHTLDVRYHNPLIRHSDNECVGTAKFCVNWLETMRKTLPTLDKLINEKPDSMVIAVKRERGEPIIRTYVEQKTDGTLIPEHVITRKRNTYNWGITITKG